MGPLNKVDDCLSVQAKRRRYLPSDYWLHVTAHVCACPARVVQVKPSILIRGGLVGWLYLKHLLDVMTS